MRKMLLSCLVIALATIVLGGAVTRPTHAAGIPPIGLVSCPIVTGFRS